jgi:hypothetical protein
VEFAGALPGALMIALGAPLTVTVCEAVVLQPLPSVTTTE